MQSISASIYPLLSNIETFQASHPGKFPDTPSQKTRFINIFHKYLSQIVVVSSTFNEDFSLAKKWLIDNLNGQQVKLKTSDGFTLDAVHLHSPTNDKGSNGKTIIFFNGNGSFYEQFAYSKAVKLSSSKCILQVPLSNFLYFYDHGYNVLLFNYRGVGDSEGYPTRQGLWLDGEAAYQYVHKNLKVANEDILLYGHSLGGAVATQTAYGHPGVNICSDRSFSLLSNVVAAYSSKIGKFCTPLLNAYDWEMNSAVLWNRISGKKCIIYHPKDNIILPKASLKHEICKQNDTDTHIITLDNDCINAYYQELARIQLDRELNKNEKKDCELDNNINSHNRRLTPSELDQVLSFFENP